MSCLQQTAESAFNIRDIVCQHPALSTHSLPQTHCKDANHVVSPVVARCLGTSQQLPVCLLYYLTAGAMQTAKLIMPGYTFI